MSREILEENFNSKNCLHLCSVCRSWEVRANFEQAGPDGERRRYSAVACAREYEVENIDPAVGILRDELTRDPNRLSSIEPRMFEHLVADVLKDAWEPCEVRLVGCSGDGGVDLVVIMGTHAEWLVQVKRRLDSRRNESCRVVRELNGTLLRKGRTKGVVVTTARDFTEAARAETEIASESATGEQYEIKLISGPDFISMMNAYPRMVVDPYSFHDIYARGSELHG